MDNYMYTNMEKDISETGGTKVVQTEVPTTLYDRFKNAAGAKDMSLKEAAREAIAEFAYRYQPIDSEDPIFTPLAVDASSEQSDPLSENVDTVVYDESGDGDT